MPAIWVGCRFAHYGRSGELSVSLVGSAGQEVCIAYQGAIAHEFCK